MNLERTLAEYVSDTEFDDLPGEPVDIIKKVVLTIMGTTIAGATSEGCEALVHQVKEWSGREEATILVHGGRVPAVNAVLVNSYMARALDFCDGMAPGVHFGASSVPTALAMAELVGGCSGKQFLTALACGVEVGTRINFSSDYDGFDPTGVCVVFATAAIAGKLLRLDSRQMGDALALAFNRSGGSFQSNVDGSLAVRAIQGFVSQAGITSAQLARIGITGPKNFLEGVYGYFHLYAKDKYDPESVIGNLGKSYKLLNFMFKKYPSCGGTLASTDAIMALIAENRFNPEDIARIDIKVQPYVYKLVGHQFEVGDNPKVNAQFNIQYCVANALLRKSSRLQHFEESAIRDPGIMELIKKVHVAADPALSTSTTAEMHVTTRDGKVYPKTVDVPRGFPDNPLTDEEHSERFRDCLSYGRKPLAKGNIDKIVSLVNRLEEIEDVRSLVPLLLS